jgi:hypothetical protein
MIHENSKIGNYLGIGKLRNSKDNWQNLPFKLKDARISADSSIGDLKGLRFFFR